MRVRRSRRKKSVMEERKAIRDKEAAEREDRKEKRAAKREGEEMARAQERRPESNEAEELQKDTRSTVRKKEPARARRGRRGFRSRRASAARG
jgi:hypothetical protein